jgi:UbiD family decarboxylase
VSASIHSQDIRAWMAAVAAQEELKVVEGADWNLEIGAISELNYRQPNNTALLFDQIKGYPQGFRVLTGATGSPKRLGITFNLGLPTTDAAVVKALRGKPLQWEAGAQHYPPVTVPTGPVMENSWYGEQVDLHQLPAPLWHEHDGGRYLGTGSVCITRDPDGDWVNLGAYRGMVVDGNKMTVLIATGKHGDMHLKKWFEREGRAPMAVALGGHPLLTCLAGLEVPLGVGEYAYAGAVLGEAVEVVTGPITGLPIPAHAEIVLEGFVEPGKRASEGPFGEWTGYYSPSEGPVIYLQVEAMHFRKDPVLLGMPPGYPPFDYSYMRSALKSAMIYDGLVKAGCGDIHGVWAPESGGGRLLINVAMKQRFCGHAKQVGLLATALPVSAYMNRYVIMVDEDVDPTNMNEVMWAMCTRADPGKDFQILAGLSGGARDPLIDDPDRTYMSRAVIDACIPFERRKSFPTVARSSPELLQQVHDKWKAVWA